MREALAGVDVWVTGLSRSQSPARADLRVVEWDWNYQLLKVNPLAGWDRARVWEYVQQHDVPYNELHDRGYPTLGCTHCTAPVPGNVTGEYTREGRWPGRGEERVRAASDRGGAGVVRTRSMTSSRAKRGILPAGIEAGKKIPRYARDDSSHRLHRKRSCPRNPRSSTPSATADISAAPSRRRCAADATHFGDDDATLLKFHGTYQQDDRDARRRPGRGRGEGVLVHGAGGAPGRGARPPTQYLALEDVADRHANGTLRVTTRQGFQFHGVLKGDLKPTIAEINHPLITTLAACGDVNRNVMGCPAPLDDEAAPRAARRGREASPSSCAPPPARTTRSGSTASGRSRPRRRSRSTATSTCRGSSRPASRLSTDNCVDIWSQDVGLVAIVDGRTVAGYNVLVGGGLGMTHHKADTTARLAQPLGFVEPAHAVEAVRIVAAIFRDHGNRADRRHARLKYLVADWGIEKFRAEFASRAPASRSRRRCRSPRCPTTTISAATASPTAAGSTASSSRAAGSPTPAAIRLKTALHEIVDPLAPGRAAHGPAERAAHRPRRRRR